MAYYKPNQFTSKTEFRKDRISMTLGSLCNLYSNSQHPPSSKEVFEEAIEITDKIWDLDKRYDAFPELEKKLEEEFKEQHEKRVGRYNSSELWGLFNNKILPEDYLKSRVFNEESKRKMYFGIVIHEGIQKLFGFEEKKYEIKVADDIVIVCKIDLELGNKIFEFKTREDIESFDDVPDWYDIQCQCYCEAKNLPEIYLYLIGWGLSRKLFQVKRNKKTFQNIVNRIKDYHSKVVDANKK